MESSQTQEKLIVFTRYPEPGTTKTRLANALGDQEAAAVQKKLSLHTMKLVKGFMQLCPVSVTVSFNGGSIQKMQQWLGPDFIYQAQGKGDLGERMAEAFTEAFNRKYKRIIIIGTDCPELTSAHIIEAFASLHLKDLVLGPATDGGYYLIGLSRNETSLFKGVAWGTDSVLAKTANIAAEKGLTLKLLGTLNDVDRPEDLKNIGYHSDL